MKSTYTIKEAQRNLAAMVRAAEGSRLVTITRHQKPVAYLLGPDHLSEILETMEVLADPEAMKAIADAEAGRGKIFAAEELSE